MIEILNPPKIEIKGARKVSPLGFTPEPVKKSDLEIYLEKQAKERKAEEKRIKQEKIQAKRRMSKLRQNIVLLRIKLKAAEADYDQALAEFKKL